MVVGISYMVPFILKGFSVQAYRLQRDHCPALGASAAAGQHPVSGALQHFPAPGPRVGEKGLCAGLAPSRGWAGRVHELSWF